MTNRQLAMLHTAKGKIGMEDADYRTLLRNVGGLRGDRPSSKDLTQAGFEKVMAFFAQHGAVSDRTGHWQRQASGEFATTRQSHAIEQLAAMTKYDLAGLCRQFSLNRATVPGRLTRREAYKLTEMLKSVVERNMGEGKKDCLHSDKDVPHGGGAAKDGR